MPDFYPPGEYDLAGFIVGVVDKQKVIDGKSITPGDVVLGIPSTGLQTNGYSLARKLFFEVGGYTYDSYVDELGKTVGEACSQHTNRSCRRSGRCLTRPQERTRASVLR